MAHEKAKGSRRKRRTRNFRQRTAEIREVRQRFLIVCEGEKTEPNYFKSFRVPGLTIDAKGLGISPRQLVDEALRRKELDEYDQTWCVFDRDDCSLVEFNEALQRAGRLDVRVAYSNQAFELWYLLHYDFHNTAIPRKTYRQKLSKSLGRAYRKNDPSIYDMLLPRQESAIKHAESLLKQYFPLSPARDDPSTTVHLLVQELRRFS